MAAGESYFNTDCVDSDPIQFPGQSRWKDIDNDGFGDGTSLNQCNQPVGYKISSDLTALNTDCDDTDGNNYP